MILQQIKIFINKLTRRFWDYQFSRPSLSWCTFLFKNRQRKIKIAVAFAAVNWSLSVAGVNHTRLTVPRLRGFFWSCLLFWKKI